LRSLWEERDFSEESIDPEVFRHDGSDATLKEFTALRRGRSLVAQKRCGSCQDSGTEQLMPELLLKGPSLDGIGDRLRHDWLARWILDPRKIRPQSHMPAVFQGEGAKEKAAHIADFLSAGSHPGGVDPVPDGKSVFVEVENLQPVHMMQIDLDLETEEGEEIVTKIWNTIHVAKDDPGKDLLFERSDFDVSVGDRTVVTLEHDGAGSGFASGDS